MKTRLIFCAVCATLLTPLSQAIKYNEIPGSDAIHLDRGKAYENVALVNTGTTLASGTLIGDRWILTAGHVMDGTAASTNVTFETSAGVRSTYGVIEQYIHPVFESLGVPFFDLGLYKLDKAVSGIAAAQLFDPSQSSSGFPIVGETRFDMAGFGLHGAGNGSVDYDGQRRWGENLVEGFGGLLSDGSIANGAGDPLVWLSYFDELASPFSIGQESIATRGDSGGGWFFDDGGSQKLFAISVRSSDDFDGLPVSGGVSGIPYPNYGDSMEGISLHRHLDWIQQTTKVPDASSTFALLGLGFIGLLGGRAFKSRRA